MKKLKVIIIILIMCICITIISMFIIKYMDQKNNKTEIIEQENLPHSSEANYEINNKDILIEENFYTVSACVSEYMNLINKNNSIYYGYNDNNEYTKITNPAECIINILSHTYKKENNININNLENNIKLLEDNVIFVPINMKVITNDVIEKYLVYGIIEDLDNNYISDVYVFVNLDSVNSTFSIEPIDNIESKNIDDIEFSNNETSIQSNDWNNYEEVNQDKEYITKMFLDRYKKLCLAKPEIAYEFLDNEYKNIRFGNVDNYKEYISNNKEEIISIQGEKYNIEDKGEYTEYTIQDQYEKKYIFNIKNIIDFTVKLDDYNIPTETFKQTYADATDQQKVALNINKFIQAINNSDYRYAYNCLADSYKNNYFKTQEEFETYAKENFYKSSNVGYVEFDKQGDVYTYKVILTDKESEDKKNKTFIMQLGEGTNFVLSFDK